MGVLSRGFPKTRSPERLPRRPIKRMKHSLVFAVGRLLDQGDQDAVERIPVELPLEENDPISGSSFGLLPSP